eukprot:7930563-Alexandrium_andersonii.AAC.1
MSASLVGSEMCIRDRHIGVQVCRHVRAGNSGRALVASSRPSRSTAGRGCLLYTSDAADDM